MSDAIAIDIGMLLVLQLLLISLPTLYSVAAQDIRASAVERLALRKRLLAIEEEARVLRRLLSQDEASAVATGERGVLPRAPAASSQFNEDSDLKSHFDNITAGPGSMKWKHYFDIYYKHLVRFRNTDVHVVEVGVFAGGGLRMWRWFFGKRARIFGIDFANGTRAYERNLNYGRPDRVFIGDQGNWNFWKRVMRRLPRIDVVLDDGGHEPEQQETTLRALLPHLSPGGVYLCEDVHGVNEFAKHVFTEYIYGTDSKGLNAYSNYQKIDNVTTLGTISQPSSVQQTVAEVSFYPFVVVLEKTPKRRTEMVGYRRGNLWRRFRLTNGDFFAFPGTCAVPSDCPLL